MSTKGDVTSVHYGIQELGLTNMTSLQTLNISLQFNNCTDVSHVVINWSKMEEKPDNYLGLHSAILIALGLCISIQVSLTFFWESQWAKMKKNVKFFFTPRHLQ